MKLKCETKYESRNEISFPVTHSVIFIGTAGARKFGRGDTITDLHMSEVAFWENPDELVAGLLQAVPEDSGIIFAESTGNGPGGWFYDRVMDALSNPHSKWKLHFFPWYVHPEYKVTLSEKEKQELAENLTEEERKWMKKYNLSLEQVIWYRLKSQDFENTPRGRALLRREYPFEVSDAFAIAEGGEFFPKVEFKPLQANKNRQGIYVVPGHPRPDLHYVIGADVGGGVGQDYSVMVVLCVETYETVGLFSSNRVAPDDFGELLQEVGVTFNKAYLVVEANNHGQTTLSVLWKSSYPKGLIFRRPGITGVQTLGFLTSSKTKPYVIGNLRKHLEDGLVIRFSRIKTELDLFREYESGKLSAPPGCHDDCVMALALACVGYDKYAPVVYSRPAHPVERKIVYNGFRVRWEDLFEKKKKPSLFIHLGR